MDKNIVKLNDELLDNVSGGLEEHEGKKHDEEIDVLECLVSPNGHHDFSFLVHEYGHDKEYQCSWCGAIRKFSS